MHALFHQEPQLTVLAFFGFAAPDEHHEQIVGIGDGFCARRHVEKERVACVEDDDGQHAGLACP